MRLTMISKQIFLGVLFFTLLGVFSYAQNKPNFVIVIDPGHGGKIVEQEV